MAYTTWNADRLSKRGTSFPFRKQSYIISMDGHVASYSVLDLIPSWPLSLLLTSFSLFKYNANGKGKEGGLVSMQLSNFIEV
jgi:hypothetical protein